LIFFYFPWGAMDDVPGVNAIYEVPDRAAPVNASQSQDETGKDSWVNGRPVSLVDVPGVAK
jgi:hypothetical protein